MFRNSRKLTCSKVGKGYCGHIKSGKCPAEIYKKATKADCGSKGHGQGKCMWTGSCQNDPEGFIHPQTGKRTFVCDHKTKKTLGSIKNRGECETSDSIDGPNGCMWVGHCGHQVGTTCPDTFYRKVGEKDKATCGTQGASIGSCAWTNDLDQCVEKNFDKYVQREVDSKCGEMAVRNEQQCETRDDHLASFRCPEPFDSFCEQKSNSAASALLQKHDRGVCQSLIPGAKQGMFKRQDCKVEEGLSERIAREKAGIYEMEEAECKKCAKVDAFSDKNVTRLSLIHI